MKFIKKFKVAAMVAGTALFASSFAANSANVTEWKMHIALVDGRAETEAARQFAQEVNKELADELKITLYSGGSLGINDADMLRILPRGSVIQAAALYPGYLTRDNPDFAYILPAGVATSPEAYVESFPTLEKIYNKVYDSVGVKALGYVGHHVRDTHIMCKEPTKSLEELKDKKVRVWEQFNIDVFRKLGISAQIIGQNDLYLAMQTGVVDCAVYPVGLATTISLHEVAPYASYLFPYVMHPWTIVVSESAFNELSSSAQETLLEIANNIELETHENYLSGAADKKATKAFIDAGGTVLEPFSQEDQDIFLKTAQDMWAKLADEGSDERKENYENVLSVIN